MRDPSSVIEFTKYIQGIPVKSTELEKGISGVINSQRWVPIKLLGEGAWGSVYLVEDKEMGGYFALKKYRETEANKEKRERRGLSIEDLARKDARGPRTAKHVVSSILIQDDDEQRFVLMDLYNKSLADILMPVYSNSRERHSLKDSSLEKGKIISYIKQMCIGLNELYESMQKDFDWQQSRSKIHGRFNPAHGDIKPDNIMVNEKGELVLADKGTSTCYSEKDAARDNIGNFAIRAFELFKEGSRPDVQTDVFSLGANLYNMLMVDFPSRKNFRRIMIIIAHMLASSTKR